MSHMSLRAVLSASLVACVLAPAASPAQPVNRPAPDGGLPSWRAGELRVVGTRPAYRAAETRAATRTETPLGRLPQSVQVLTRTLLEEQDARSLTDALVNVSGAVPIKTEELVLAEPLIRGFPAELYLDGLPAFGLTSVIDPASLVGIERVTVVKGPTDALFGGGAGSPLGGVIDLMPAVPGRDIAGRVEARAGSFESYAGAADLSLPLLPDGVAGLRIAGEAQSRESFIDHLRSERRFATATLTAELGPATDVTIQAWGSRVEQLEYAGLPAFLLGVADREAFSGAADAPETEVENRVLSATLTHRVDTDLQISLRARRYESAFVEQVSFPFFAFFPCAGTVCPLIKGILPTDTDQSTVEATAVGSARTGPLEHRLLLGASWDETDYDAAVGFEFAPIGVIDYANPGRGPAFGARPSVTRTQTDRYETLSVFAQDQIALGTDIDLLLALGWRRLEFARIESGVATEFYRFTPRAGLVWTPLEGIGLFAGYAEGFRAPTGFFGPAPRPETSAAYEVGLKLTEPVPGLSGTLALFHQTRENVPTADPANPFQSIQTGEQRSQGVELDLLYEPFPDLSLLATYAFTEAEVERDTVIPVGDRLPRVPRHAGRLAARWRWRDGPLAGLAVGGGVTFVGDRELTLPNDLAAEGYAIGDLQVAYEAGALRLGVSVRNLWDVEAEDPYQFLAQPVVIPVAPLGAELSATLRF